MKNIEKLVGLTFMVLLIVNAFVVLKGKSSKEKIVVKTESKPLKVNDEILLTYNYYENLALGKEISGADVECIEDNFNLKNLVGEDGALIFRYDEVHCDVCVDSTITLLNDISAEISNTNVLYFTTYSNPRDKVVFQRLNDIKNPIINISKFDNKMELVDSPYLIYVDKDLRITNALFVDKEYIPRMKRFLNAIKARF